MNKTRPRLAAAGRILLALTTLLLLTGPPVTAVTRPTVGIKEFKYAPPVLRIAKGTMVTWINHDEEPHTVTSATGAFASTGLANEDTFTQTFTKPGTYQYFCALHPHMTATVIVK
jgi:plastocyanin